MIEGRFCKLGTVVITCRVFITITLCCVFFFFCLISLECKLGKEDFLVMELLRWFKKEFFSWVNCLPCSQCGGETKTAGSLNPSAEDTRWGAQRVESHYCQSCHVATRFPR